MGINTNIMFPPPDVSILRIVDNISRSGSLYAVVITSQNFYHKSCTLNVLHGAPQGIVFSGLNIFLIYGCSTTDIGTRCSLIENWLCMDESL